MTSLRLQLLLLASPLALIPVTAAAAQEDGALDEIVVTAQKREQSLVDVPISIGVVDRDALARARASELRDLSRLVPNFSVQRQGAIDTVFIRGVGGGGRNVGFTTRAGVYVDGVYAGQFASVNQELLDVARVEVLRGPQGHLFGRNTDAGAVSIVTAAPGPDFSAEAEGTYGNKDLFELKGVVNAPLGEGVALRLAGAHHERDGFTLNVPTGIDLDNINRGSARGRLRAALSPALTLDLAGDYSRDRSNKAIGEALTDTFGTGPTPLPGAFDTPYNRDPLQDIELGGGSATLGWDAGRGLTLTAISGWRATDWRRTNDLDYVPFDFAAMDYRDRFRQFSQELRLNAEGEALSGVAGLYFLDERARTDRRVLTGADIGFLPFGLTPGTAAQVRAKVSTSSYAAFGALDWRIAPAVTLNLGGRFTHERLTLRDYSTFGPAVFGLAAVTDFDDAQSADSFDPTIGVTVALAEATSLYAKYARGFKSGGWNVDFIGAAQFADRLRFRPERVDSIEAGLKHESADRRLRLALAAFAMRVDDYQIDQFVDLGGGQTSIQLRNAARAESWGGEASLELAPVDRLNLSAGLGYTHAEFDRFPDGGGPGVDLDGNRLPYAPRFTANAGAAYDVDLAPFGATLALSAGWSYRSASFAGPENLARQHIDARHLVDARAELTRGGWSLGVWAKNLFGARYVDNRIFDFFQTAVVERGEPRTYGMTARAGF